MAEEIKKEEDWMQKRWRPAMGWMYMVVCICDFVLFPVLWAMLHAVLHTANMSQWNPLTLQGAGLFHLAMGAVLGIAAFGRTQEKINGANISGMQPVAQSVMTTYTTPPTYSTTPIRPIPRPLVSELEAGDPPTRNTRND